MQAAIRRWLEEIAGSINMSVTEQNLIEKIMQLPPQRLAEVENFVDFLHARDEQRLTQAATKAAVASFDAVWNNDEDAAYDRM